MSTADLVYRIRYAISIDNWVEVEQLVVLGNSDQNAYFEATTGTVIAYTPLNPF